MRCSTSFYRRVRPGGPGWAHVSERLGFGRETIPGGALAWTNWIAGIVAVYSTLFGIGKIIFGELGAGVVLLVIAAVAFAWIARSFRSEPAPPACGEAADGADRGGLAADCRSPLYGLPGSLYFVSISGHRHLAASNGGSAMSTMNQPEVHGDRHRRSPPPRSRSSWSRRTSIRPRAAFA